MLCVGSYPALAGSWHQYPHRAFTGACKHNSIVFTFTLSICVYLLFVLFIRLFSLVICYDVSAVVELCVDEKVNDCERLCAIRPFIWGLRSLHCRRSGFLFLPFLFFLIWFELRIYIFIIIIIIIIFFIFDGWLRMCLEGLSLLCFILTLDSCSYLASGQGEGSDSQVSDFNVCWGCLVMHPNIQCIF